MQTPNNPKNLPGNKDSEKKPGQGQGPQQGKPDQGNRQQPGQQQGKPDQGNQQQGKPDQGQGKGGPQGRSDQGQGQGKAYQQGKQQPQQKNTGGRDQGDSYTEDHLEDQTITDQPGRSPGRGQGVRSDD